MMTLNSKLEYLLITVFLTILPSLNLFSQDLIITTKAELIAFANAVNNGNNYNGKVVVLGADINMAQDKTFKPIGNTANRVFKGTFDGQGYTIDNLYYNTTSTPVVAGLFGYVDGATIKNVIISNADITVSQVGGDDDIAGGIAGIVQGGATIDGCIVKSSSISARNYTGGIVGKLNDGSITNCSAIDNELIRANAITLIGNDTYAGGIAGDMDSKKATISGCSVGGNNITATNSSQAHEFVGGGSTNNNNVAINNTNMDKLAESGEVRLDVGHWNFIGSWGTTFGDLNNNDGGNDIAALAYDSTANKWEEKYVYADDGIIRADGYMVYVFGNKPLTQDEINAGKTEGEKLTNTYTTLKPTFSSDAVVINKTTKGNLHNNAYWIALSNPFGKTLTVEKILNSLNGEQGSSVYVYNAATDKWITKTGTSKINPSQGFMLASDKGTITGTLTTSGKKDEKDIQFIEFSVLANVRMQKVYAFVGDNNSDGFDEKDSYFLSANNERIVEPYFDVEGRKIVVNAFKSLPYECPINFYAKKVSDATLFVSNVPDGIDVSIINKEDGTETLLTDGESFYFTAAEGENEGRFVIKFANKNTSITDINSSNADIKITNTDNVISVSAKNLKNVQVINSLGQVVYSKTANSDFQTLTLNAQSGIYIVKAKSSDGEKTEKIVIK